MVFLLAKLLEIYNPVGHSQWTYDYSPSKGAETYSQKMIIHCVAQGGKQIKFFAKFHVITNVIAELNPIRSGIKNCKHRGPKLKNLFCS